MNMNGEGESIQCSMQDGVLTADGVGIALQNSMLVVSEDGMTMTLSREKPEASAAPIGRAGSVWEHPSVLTVTSTGELFQLTHF